MYAGICSSRCLDETIDRGVLGRLPKTLTKKHYLDVEQRFKKLANKVHIPVDELDCMPFDISPLTMDN
jgi:thermostable 8-oxoguanine DNA glycosylase